MVDWAYHHISSISLLQENRLHFHYRSNHCNKFRIGNEQATEVDYLAICSGRHLSHFLLCREALVLVKLRRTGLTNLNGVWEPKLSIPSTAILIPCILFEYLGIWCSPNPSDATPARLESWWLGLPRTSLLIDSFGVDPPIAIVAPYYR